jgi:hypothetical protein
MAVFVDEIMVEGVWCSVFAYADNNLSVMKLLVGLPFIPHNNVLAHRLKLATNIRRVFGGCMSCLRKKKMNFWMNF